MAKKLKPVHPGEMLREDFLKPYGLSMTKLAMDLHVPVTRIADIVAERRGITSDTALRLGRYFKTSPEFWLNIQRRTELWEATNSPQEMERIGRAKAIVAAG